MARSVMAKCLIACSAPAILMLLAACTMPVKNSMPPAMTTVPAATPSATAAVKPTMTILPSEPVPSDASRSPWDRLRERLKMHGCDYRSEVTVWAERYTRSPRSFEQSMQRSLPFLLLVIDELERRNLPGEFAMLPFVESRYEPVATSGNRPAGMWQLMPITARGNGMEVTAGYDERLDPMMATRISLGLIERYSEKFNDWRLANMAFNAGEFRVLKLLNGREPSSFSAEQLAQLSFSSTTHEHLDKLLALSCIVDEPGRFGVRLPEPVASDHLLEIELAAPLDLRVASRLADVDEEVMLRYNAAWRGNRMDGSPPYRLLLPADRSEALQERLEQIPQDRWAEWREVRTRRSTDWITLAASSELPPEWLATLNGDDDGGAIGSGVSVLLPGSEATVSAGHAASALSQLRSHIVKSGDTLGAIAQRYGLKLAQLLHWNSTSAKATLQPGDRILLSPMREP